MFFKDEKSPKIQATIRQKVQEYMNRAEKLKEFLEKGGPKQAVKDGGKDKDKYLKKLMRIEMKKQNKTNKFQY